MPRRITPQTSLDTLKKEAKRWLKALRGGDAGARARLERAFPGAPASPSLRDVQHALAREFERDGWTALKAAVGAPADGAPRGEQTHATLVNRFLEYACPDHHVRGLPAHRVARHAAMRLLERHPEIAREDLYTAAVCGERDEVARLLDERPALANARRSASGPDRSGGGGSFDFLDDMGTKPWAPLLYVCFTRLPHAPSNANAVEIARLLLDRGADPNAYFMAGDSRYTPLTGVAGEGEENRPPHPRRDDLARLLLERGANPYDIQVVYNLGFHGQVLWYLKLAREFSVNAGRGADWEDPEWHMLDMGGYGSGARWFLRIAVENNDVELAEWCLAHGATPNAPPEQDTRFPRRSLYEHALELGHVEVAGALARGGAERTSVARDGEGAFVAACLRMDRPEIARLSAEHPEYLHSTRAMFAAAERDRADLVELLLDLGTPIEIEDKNRKRPLHVAAENDALRVAEWLIARGAEIDPIEQTWSNTPIDFAVYYEHPRMCDLLALYTRDVGNLAFLGKVDRLRAVLRERPDLARTTWGSTPLFWLPDEEAAAIEIVTLFLAHGADPSFIDRDGRTAAEVARRRGLHGAAALLEAACGEARGRRRGVADYERVAEALVSVYGSGDPAALEIVRAHFNMRVSVEDVRAFAWRKVYNVRQRAGQDTEPYLTLDEARELVAREAGFGGWEALAQAASEGRPAPGPGYEIDRKENRISPRRGLQSDEWDALLDVMRTHNVTALEAGGQMTDGLLARVAKLGGVTRLHLGGCRGLTDEGLRHLARMPLLEELDISGTGITDRGLEVLRHLPNLRRLALYWQGGISDAGAAHLAACEEIEAVELMGSNTGDGVIRALAGKAKLRRLKTGRHVTDAGIEMLRDIPLFGRPSPDGPRSSPTLMDSDPGPTYLLVDGPFTNDALARLAALDGVFALDFFWHATAITSAGLAALGAMRHLEWLGYGGERCDDEAMRHIGALPRLRMLQGQNTVATDEGFEALARSRTLEVFWGRDCPNLGSRGFLALSRMPALRGLGVSCKLVSDAALSRLPRFPSLVELMPMDVSDAGFKHVGACERLERLWMMYCRDTTDSATEQIGGLSRLDTYYAGRTKITDRSLAILSGMSALERLTFWEVAGITDAGVRLLARLPRLKEVTLEGLPRVTPGALTAFGSEVRVSYTP